MFMIRNLAFDVENFCINAFLITITYKNCLHNKNLLNYSIFIIQPNNFSFRIKLYSSHHPLI